MDLFLKNVSEKLNDHFYSIMQYLMQNVTYTCNMFVMHKDVFIEYFKFIDKCINICINDMFNELDLSSRDRYQKRALGFILERMTGYWIWLQKIQNMRLNVISCPLIEENIQSQYSRI